MSRFSISHLRVGPEDLRRQLPLTGETVDIRLGPDGQTYFSARLDRQLKHRIEPSAVPFPLPAERLGSDESGTFLWVSDIVIRASTPGEAPHHGMQRFPVDLAYVLDLSYRDDQSVDFAKLQGVAAVDIDDLPQAATTEAAAEQQQTPALTDTEDSFFEPRSDHDSAETPAPPPVETQTAPTDDRREDNPAGDPDTGAPPAKTPLVGDTHAGEQFTPAEGEVESGRDLTVPWLAPASSPSPVQSSPADGEFEPDSDLTVPWSASAPSRSPVQTSPAIKPEPVMMSSRSEVSASTNGADGHAATLVPAMPATPADPTPGNPTLAHAEPLTATTPYTDESTGPLPTATTARPPTVAGAGRDFENRPRRMAAPHQRPAVRNQSVTGAPVAPPPPPSTSGLGASPYPPFRPTTVGAPLPAPPRQMPPHHSTRALTTPIAPSRRTLSTKAIAILTAVLIGAILIAIAIWNVASSDSSSGQVAAPTPARPSDADVQRVKSSVPKGYSGSSCTVNDDAAEASVDCGPNADPGGPQTATYTLYASQQALNQAFVSTIAGFDRVTCPGNIQSPGPWRRNAAPTKVAGTLFCGTRAGQAAVIWTSDEQSLLNITQAGAQGPTLDQLYLWWGTHS